MKAIFIRPYLTAVHAYFRWAKVPVSRLIGRLRPEVPFELPEFGSLDEYAGWMGEKLRWRADRFAGLLDAFPTLGHMAWQLREHGVAADDCDGLAYFSAAIVKRFVDRPEDVYIVTMVLDPRQIPVAMAAHVICVFRAGGVWRVISNNELFSPSFATFDQAVRENAYAAGKPVRLVEVRDARLKRVPAPKD